MAWLSAASQEPGKALSVGIAIWFLAGCTNKPTVTLGNELCKKFGSLYLRNGAASTPLRQRVLSTPNTTKVAGQWSHCATSHSVKMARPFTGRSRKASEGTDAGRLHNKQFDADCIKSGKERTWLEF